jgi:HSP20 family protein
MNLLNRDLDRFVSRPHGIPGADDVSNTAADWVPAVDIHEEKERFVLRADLPGVSPDNIDVNMENGVLSLSGERNAENSDEIEGLKRFERVSGKFYRRFNLPETADAEGISARCANGILEISIPKAARVQARRIEVEAA